MNPLEELPDVVLQHIVVKGLLERRDDSAGSSPGSPALSATVISQRSRGMLARRPSSSARRRLSARLAIISRPINRCDHVSQRHLR